MQQFTQTNSHHQNNVVEWRNWTLIEWAKSLAFGANIPTCLWDENVNTANYLINLSPTRVNGGLTPHQQLFRVRLNFHHLRVFSCVSFVHINVHRTKWSFKDLHSCVY
jgi:hypothetical protein